MRTRGHESVRVALLGLATAAIVLIGDGGDAFWVSAPAVLLACAGVRTRIGAATAVAAIVAAASVPAALAPGLAPLPSPLLAVLIPAACAAVLVVVRERLESERDELRHFALTDALTGVANRRALLTRIEYEVARHTRAQRSFAVLMLDLDGFKDLNDRFGHAAGDELLRDVAGALQSATRGQDTVARLGGDEFCVLAPETDPGGAQRLVDRVAEAVGEVTAGVDALRASSGVAVFPADGLSPTALLHAADERLLGAKRGRRRGRAARRAA